MKNQIIKNLFSKLFVVIGLATILTGAVFAQTQSLLVNVDPTISEKVRRVLNREAKRHNLGANRNLSEKGQYVSAVNQRNFNVGSNFVFALTSAASIARSKEAVNTTIVEIVYLIDSLDGEPEAAELQKTLTSLVRRTAQPEQIVQAITDALASYGAHLQKEQKWHLDLGTNVSSLIFSAYVGDAKTVRIFLSSIRTLIRLAPQGTSGEIIDGMQSLVKFVSQTAFVKDDYNALLTGAFGVTKTVNA